MSSVALIVDDDPTVLELIAEMLEELGCEVITRQDAAEALTALELRWRRFRQSIG